jgi:hypothetical protein
MRYQIPRGPLHLARGMVAHYNEYVGVCVELPYLRREAPTAPEAVAAIQEALV